MLIEKNINAILPYIPIKAKNTDKGAYMMNRIFICLH